VPDSVVQRCDRASRLVDLISGAGPVKVTVALPRQVLIEHGTAVVDTIEDAAVAEFLDAAPGLVRTLAEAVATVYTAHTPQPDVELCPQCGVPDPCTTRRLLDAHILRSTEPATQDASDASDASGKPRR
jgi:hypothetical protein